MHGSWQTSLLWTLVQLPAQPDLLPFWKKPWLSSQLSLSPSVSAQRKCLSTLYTNKKKTREQHSAAAGTYWYSQTIRPVPSDPPSTGPPSESRTFLHRRDRFALEMDCFPRINVIIINSDIDRGIQLRNYQTDLWGAAEESRMKTQFSTVSTVSVTGATLSFQKLHELTTGFTFWSFTLPLNSHSWKSQSCYPSSDTGWLGTSAAWSVASAQTRQPDTSQIRWHVHVAPNPCIGSGKDSRKKISSSTVSKNLVFSGYSLPSFLNPGAVIWHMQGVIPPAATPRTSQISSRTDPTNPACIPFKISPRTFCQWH